MKNRLTFEQIQKDVIDHRERNMACIHIFGVDMGDPYGKIRDIKTYFDYINDELVFGEDIDIDEYWIIGYYIEDL